MESFSLSPTQAPTRPVIIFRFILIFRRIYCLIQILPNICVSIVGVCARDSQIKTKAIYHFVYSLNFRVFFVASTSDCALFVCISFQTFFSSSLFLRTIFSFLYFVTWNNLTFSCYLATLGYTNYIYRYWFWRKSLILFGEHE